MTRKRDTDRQVSDEFDVQTGEHDESCPVFDDELDDVLYARMEECDFCAHPVAECACMMLEVEDGDGWISERVDV